MSEEIHVTNICHYCGAVGPDPHSPTCAYWLTLKDMEGTRVSHSDYPLTGAAQAALGIENARHKLVERQVMGEHMTEMQGNVPIIKRDPAEFVEDFSDPEKAALATEVAQLRDQLRYANGVKLNLEQFIKKVCERAPPPLDDVGGCEASDFYPEEAAEFGFEFPDYDDDPLDDLFQDEDMDSDNLIPSDSAARKAIPLCRGVVDYFPLALAEIARVSRAGNEQHNPGEPLHWARDKSTDHEDCIVRHLIDRGKMDSDGQLHTAKLAWRALALLQTELEEEGL